MTENQEEYDEIRYRHRVTHLWFSLGTVCQVSPLPDGDVDNVPPTWFLSQY
jgi:hypothetical protein